MKKMLVNELLERNRKMLKAMHELYDMDFNADFNIVKFTGKFTLNSIKKTINSTDIDGYNVAVILCDIKYREDYNYIIKAYNNGFSISHERRVYTRYIDDFYSKGTFEDCRKDNNKTVYVVWQKKELAKKASNKKPDYTQRFCFIRSIGWSDGRGRHGISQFDVKDMQHNGRKINIKTRDSLASTDINYYIDKSGYLVEEKKLELKRRAKALKAKRAKQLVDNINFDNEIRNIETELKNINSHICFMLNDVNNYDSIKKVDDIISKLRWFYISFDNFREANKNKRFSSVENARYKLNEIIEKLNDIHMMIN